MKDLKERLWKITELDEPFVSAYIDELSKDILEARKQCSTCKVVFPRTLEWFAKHPNTKDGLQSQCRSCGINANKVSEEKRKQKVEPLVTDYYDEDFYSQYK